MKQSKKVLALVLSLVLVVGCAVGGMYAWLQEEADPVVNTFVAGKLIDPDQGGVFELKEHKATRQPNGTYDLENSIEVDRNEYIVMPGVDLAKDPFVQVKTAEQAYLFVEVVNTLPTGMTATVNTDQWTEVVGAVGQNGGKVYTLKDGPLAPAEELATHYILKDNKVVVDKDFAAPEDGIGNLEFYGYLTQAAGFDSAIDAWNANFGVEE